MTSLIEGKLKSFDESQLNNKDLFWNFYQAYNLTGNFNKIKAKYRNSLFVNFLNGDNVSKIKLGILINKDREKIYSFLSNLKEEEGESSTIGNFHKKGRFGVLSYDYD